jgi:RNA-directed DNA polymerase
MLGGVAVRTEMGTPQGGSLSLILVNIYLDDLDKKLEKRDHKFVRYADDCNIYVRSRRAAERVMESIQSFLQKRLKLKVKEEKSNVNRPCNIWVSACTRTRAGSSSDCHPGPSSG